MKVNFLKERIVTASTTIAAILLAGATVGLSVSLAYMIVKLTVAIWV